MSVFNRINFGSARVRVPFWAVAGLALIAAPAATFAQTANCTLLVPAAPLTAAGLMTPYQLSPTNPPSMGGTDVCDETDPGMGSAIFVQAVIYDPSGMLCAKSGPTASICIYNPVVVNATDPTPAVPVVPITLPAGAIVGLWFGGNGGTLTLTASGTTLTDNNCVTGLGQFSYCNAVAFFAAVNAGGSGITVPALGTGSDNQPCPTSRHFGVVDQDQSDNQTTWYVIEPATMTAGARIAQYNTANNSVAGSTTLVNPSDEWLVAQHMISPLVVPRGAFPT